MLVDRIRAWRSGFFYCRLGAMGGLIVAATVSQTVLKLLGVAATAMIPFVREICGNEPPSSERPLTQFGRPVAAGLCRAAIPSRIIELHGFDVRAPAGVLE
jgi:hypothetical protein